MPANRIQLQSALQKPYDRFLFAKDILKPIFNSYLTLNSSLVKPSIQPNQSESAVIENVGIYGKITLEDATEVTCYEIILKPNVRLEYSKVAIQHYVRKLLTVGQAAFISFISPSYPDFWRLTLVAKDSVLTEKGITEKATNAKRYTYLLGPSETCKTPAERFELLSIEIKLDLDILVRAFSVDKLSKSFFDEYTEHYRNFVQYISGRRMVKEDGKYIEKKLSPPSPFLKSVFNGDEKSCRDFTKKLLGRIVFLYFVQKKRWLGASDINYKDGQTNFIMQLFNLSGSSTSFYPYWLSKLFFDTLNNERKDDVFEMPDKTKVKIPFLNGGLFDKEAHDEIYITFPENLFHNSDSEDDPKYRGFLDFLNAFNFTIYEDSLDEKTVAVDPEMLGHIFENLLEDNKDKGAFYTPKVIVHYMCQESLIEYLTIHLSKEYTVYRSLGKDQIEFFGNETRVGQLSLLEQMGDRALNRDDVSNIVKTKDISRLKKEQLTRIDQLLDSVKICDPAIGSGAFPMGLLQEIYSIKEVIAYETGRKWKPAEVKENIIQNSIYGVDIEKGAVDIARLRFWLSLVVDEEKPKPLPNLDYKIVVGDSLVSIFDEEVVEIEWERPNTSIGKGQDYILKIHNLLLQIADKQKKYFHPDIKNKRKLTDEIRSLKIELLINQLSFNKLNYITKNPETIDFGFGLTAKEKTKIVEIKLTITKYDHLIKKLISLKKHPDHLFKHFDWKLDFPEVLNPYIAGDNVGFDVVIGNPPYIQLQKDAGRLSKIYEGQNYQSFEKTGDIYALFYEKGHLLLRPNGILCLITSNKWMRAGYGESLRKYLTEKTNPILLIDFAGQKIFETATVDTNILLLKKNKYKTLTKTCIVKNCCDGNLSGYIQNNSSSTKFSGGNSWLILNSIEQRIKEKIERFGTPLKDWDINIYRGVLTGYNEAFIIDGKKKDELIAEDPKSAEIIRPILRGRDIKRFGCNFADLWLINTHNGIKEKDVKPINIKDYPAIKRHLDKYFPELKKRADQGDTPYNLRNCAYMEDFFRPKIVYPNMTKFLPFAYDEDGFFTNQKCFIVTGEHIAYLTAFFNSSLFKYAFRDNFPELQGGTRELSKIFFDKIPVKQVDDRLESPFRNLVIQIQELKRQNKDSRPIEEKVDQLFFEIYQFTNEEKQLIGFIEIA